MRSGSSNSASAMVVERMAETVVVMDLSSK
jgi:hypothetical protein